MGTLPSGARSLGPGGNTAVGSLQLRPGWEHCHQELAGGGGEEEEEEEEGGVACIISNNPHLTGGEIKHGVLPLEGPWTNLWRIVIHPRPHQLGLVSKGHCIALAATRSPKNIVQIVSKRSSYNVYMLRPHKNHPNHHKNCIIGHLLFSTDAKKSPRRKSHVAHPRFGGVKLRAELFTDLGKGSVDRWR